MRFLPDSDGMLLPSAVMSCTVQYIWGVIGEESGRRGDEERRDHGEERR